MSLNVSLKASHFAGLQRSPLRAWGHSSKRANSKYKIPSVWGIIQTLLQKSKVHFTIYMFILIFKNVLNYLFSVDSIEIVTLLSYRLLHMPSIGSLLSYRLTLPYKAVTTFDINRFLLVALVPVAPGCSSNSRGCFLRNPQFPLPSNLSAFLQVPAQAVSWLYHNHSIAYFFYQKSLSQGQCWGLNIRSNSCSVQPWPGTLFLLRTTITVVAFRSQSTLQTFPCVILTATLYMLSLSPFSDQT